MSDRDRLIELLKKADSATWGQTYESYADYLLANGVIVLPCQKGAALNRNGNIYCEDDVFLTEQEAKQKAQSYIRR